MAINNPYIPGDPYSYDLKWLVAKVKEILAQLGTLDEAIEEKIFEGFLEHSIVQFQTVPEMLAADITDGSIVLTLGYHEAGDLGGLFYLVKDFNPSQCSLDYFLTMDNNAQIAIPIIVTDYVTPEMFGAYGDGTADDTEALQLAINTGHSNEKKVVLNREYAVSAPIEIFGGSDNTEPGTTVTGNNKGDAVIKAIASMETLISVTSESSDAANVFLSHLQIDCNEQAENGITLQKSTANSEFYDLKINKATSKGFTNVSNFYLSTIEKVRVDNTPEGFYIVDGINTSLNIKDCFVQGATNAYQIWAIYSLYQNCCADNISGIVFNFTHFTGSAISCGSEATGADVMFQGGLGTNVDVIGAMTFYLTKTNAIQINCGPGSTWRFYGGRISHSESGLTSPGKMYQLAMSAQLSFNDVTLGKVAQSNDYVNMSARVSFKDGYGQLSTRYDAKVAYIGRDGYYDEGKIDPSDTSNTTKANAIYMGLDDRAHKADGTNLQYNAYTMKGDILLTQEPVKYACAGWIQNDDLTGVSGATWTSGTFKKIPIVLSGPTANRPTLYTADAGIMYLDTTLIKPVWWTGTRWIDATGATA